MLMRSAGRTAMVAALALAALVALPAAAGAGGFATVGLSSLPDGTAPGTPWHVTLTILQHGRTPLSTLRPTIRVSSPDGQTVKLFEARSAARPGTYTADVVFPSAGRWAYSVNDDFSQTHRFAPVVIGGSRAVAEPGSQSGAGPGGANGPADGDGGGGGGGSLLAALGAAVAAGLLAALAAMLLLRRATPGGETAGTPAAPR